MEVRLVSATQDGEKTIAYCARVSNPGNQENPDFAKLLKYCLRKAHWSVFEQADMTIEIQTSRAISAQILRHKSFSAQEFSQRYAEIQGFEIYEARRQDLKNRQNSVDDLPEGTKAWFNDAQKEVQELCLARYRKALTLGIAKEQARFLLPMSTKTTLYLKGSVRSWLTLFQVRLEAGTQKEFREIAWAAYGLFKECYPLIASVFEETHADLFAPSSCS